MNWLSQVQIAIARNQIAPRFAPTFQPIMTLPLPNAGVQEEEFNAALNTFSTVILQWYKNAQFNGNINEIEVQLNNSKPKWILPSVPKPLADVSDPNVKAIVEYREQWYVRAVSSKQIQPAFFPSYISQVTNLPYPPKGVNEEDFNANVNISAEAIKNWYTASQFSGNLQVLANVIDSTKPTYTQPAPTPCPPAPSCPPDPSPQTLAIANRFFTFDGAPATINFAGEFENYRGLSDADVLDITTLLNTSTSTANFNSIVDRLEAEKRNLDGEITGRRTKAEAINQQFVEEKFGAGSVTKSKVMVLQDYILAGFAISYLFFAVVVIFYLTKKSEVPIRTFTVLTTLMVVVTAILYTWTSYLA